MTETDPTHWEGDVDDAVVDEWLESTTKFERVSEVLRSTTTPQYARVIAERARVSEPTARKHLETLAETGFAETVATGRGTQYRRSRQTVAMRRITEIHRELTREELAAGIRDLRARLREFRDEYDAADPDDLAFQLESDADEGWTAVTEWRATETDLEVAKAALALYDFDPDTGTGARIDDDSTDRGAFASDPLDASV